MDAFINETMLPPMRARSTIPTSARLRCGAKALSDASAIPMEPKLANPMEKTAPVSQKGDQGSRTRQCIGQNDLGTILEQRNEKLGIDPYN